MNETSRLDVLESRFNEHMRDAEIRFETYKDFAASINAKLDNKVPYKHFMWTIGILFALIGGMFTYLTQQIKDLQISQHGIELNSVSMSSSLEQLTKLANRIIDNYGIEIIK